MLWWEVFLSCLTSRDYSLWLEKSKLVYEQSWREGKKDVTIWISTPHHCARSWNSSRRKSTVKHMFTVTSDWQCKWWTVWNNKVLFITAECTVQSHSYYSGPQDYHRQNLNNPFPSSVLAKLVILCNHSSSSCDKLNDKSIQDESTQSGIICRINDQWWNHSRMTFFCSCCY